MKKLLPSLNMLHKVTYSAIVVLILFFSFAEQKSAFGQAVNPGRGLYVDRFIRVNEVSPNVWVFNPNFSILGVDDDNNGIFEKEVELLEYAQKNHFTTLNLYDLTRAFDPKYIGVSVWNNADHRFETLQEHLCRFMSLARSTYGITKIYAAVGDIDEADQIIDFNTMFDRTSPNFYVGQAERATAEYTNRLKGLIETQYSLGNSNFINSELAKFVLRIAYFGGGSCAVNIDGFITEYEFWNTGTVAGNDAKTLSFESFMNDIVDIKNMYNQTHSHQLESIVYYGKNATASRANLTCAQCAVQYLDGASYTLNTGCNYCTPNSIGSNRKADKVFFEEYYRTITQFDYNNNEGVFKEPNTFGQTSIFPLFSAESKEYDADDNFFGRWMLDVPSTSGFEINNIYTAESEHYKNWKLQASAGNEENVLEPGGYQWFTSSYLLKSFANPPLFYSNSPICSSNGLNAQFTYIGPREANISYTFTLKKYNGTNAFTPFTGVTPDFSIALNQGNFLPNYTLVVADAPYTATIELNYGNGTPPVSYSEVIEVTSSSAKIAAIGYSNSNSITNVPINSCQGKQVILKATSGSNIQWYKNGVVLSGETGKYLTIDNAGDYYLIKASGGCSGMSNHIVVNSGLTPFIFIAPECSTATAMKLHAKSMTTFASPSLLNYKWNTGDVTPTINIPSSLSRKTYSVEVSNPYDNCKSTSTISFPAGNFTTGTSTVYNQTPVLNGNNYDVEFRTDETGKFPKCFISDGVTEMYFEITQLVTPGTGNPYLHKTITLPPGNYTLTVVGNGQLCGDQLTPIALGSSASFTFTQNVSGATCFGITPLIGSIDVTGVSIAGGVSPYLFGWAGLSNYIVTSNSTTASSLPAGDYVLKISNGSNYQYIHFTINEKARIVENNPAIIVDVNCNGANTGSITVDFPATYTLSWNTGATTSVISNLLAGKYTCTVTNPITNCSEVFTYMVDQLPPIGVKVLCQTTTSGNLMHLRVYGGDPFTTGAAYTLPSPWVQVNLKPDEFETTTPPTFPFNIIDAKVCTLSVANFLTSSPALPSVSVTVPTSNCVGTELCATNNSNWFYLWTPNNENTNCISPLSPDIYSVTVTDKVTGCVSVASYDFSSMNLSCCSRASALLPAAPAPNTDYNLNSDITLSADMNLDGNTVYASAGKKIIVPSPFKLTITNNSTILSCDKMWGGIEVQEGGTIKIDGNSKIMDAQYGVNIMAGGKFNIAHATFNRCYVGINFEDPGSKISLYTPQKSPYIFFQEDAALNYYNDYLLEDLHFDSKDDMGLVTSLHDGFTMQRPAPGLIPYAGIKINHFPLYIGTSNTANVNTFKNMNYGIVCANATLVLDNSSFENITSAGGYIAKGGTGVLFQSGIGDANYLIQRGLGKTNSLNPTFKNCSAGISSVGAYADVSQNYMDNITTGILFASGNLRAAQIVENTIRAKSIGIGVYYSEMNYGIRVSANDITSGIGTNGSSNATGIFVTSYSKAFFKIISNVSLRNNTIHVVGNGDGIAVTNSARTFIQQNHIFYDTEGTMGSGIKLVHSSYSKISCNDALGKYIVSSPTSQDQAGIRMVGSTYSNVECNSVDKSPYGIIYEETNTGSFMKTNSMNEHYTGLKINANALLEGGVGLGNQWLSASFGSTYGVDHNGVQISSHRFTVENGTSYITSENNHGQPVTFFDPTGNSHEDCSSSGTDLCSHIPIYMVGNGNIGDVEKQIAEGDLPAGEYSTEINYEADRELYEHLRNNPELLTNDTMLQRFYNERLNQNIGKQMDVEHESEESFVSTKTLVQNIVDNKALIQLSADIIKVNDYLISGSTDQNYIDSILLENGVLHHNMEVWINQNQALSHFIDSIVGNEVDGVKIKNNDVNPSSLVESNLKAVSEIYLSTVIKGNYEFTSQQVVILKGIAHQCPLSGGDAVYKARGMYVFINPGESYDDKTTCLLAGYYMRKAQSQTKQIATTKFNFSILPNPTSSNIFVKYSSLTDGEVVLQLINNLGRVIKTITLENKQNEREIDLIGFSPGIYFYKLTANNSVIKFGKIALVK